jgi:hypothetical protein
LKLTLEEIEEYENTINDDHWEKLYDRLIKNFEQMKKFVLPDNPIKIIFKNNRNLTYACSDESNIKINKKLVSLISYYLFENSKDDYSLIFKDLNGEKYNTTFLLIREFMVELVILHELFHIKRKHFEIVKDNKENIEYDADKKSIEYLFSKYFLIINKYGIEENYYLIEKYIYAVLHLYKIFILLKDEENSYLNEEINYRLVYSLVLIIDIKRKQPTILNISIEDLQCILNKCIYEFFLKNKCFTFDENLVDLINNSVPQFFNFLRKNDEKLNDS